ncbi:MAG: hypothetical protein ACN4GT_05610 [Gammaproteobacteria bacterium]
MRFAIMLLMLVGTSVTANTEIHRCSQEDGTVAFQEMPCPEPAMNADDGGDAAERHSDSGLPAADDGVFDFANPFDEPASPSTPMEPMPPERASSDRTECVKMSRDAIDAIDREMRETAYSKEQGQEYLAELLELTQQLRACKQL